MADDTRSSNTASSNTVSSNTVRIKRAYDGAEDEDGFRVLVDRLWPRGITKERAAIDRWEKRVAPSSELRKSWHATTDAHSPEHFAAFAEDYRTELRSGEQADALEELLELIREQAGDHRSVTLVYGAKDETANHAVVLRDAILERLDGGSGA